MTAAKIANERQDVTGDIARYYRALQQAYGKQHWWPAASRFEVVLGAFLTQSTSWRNVELALQNLRRADALRFPKISAMSEAKLARLIRPAGYFRQKAKRVKNFVRFVEAEFGGSLERLFACEPGGLRERLLALHGIGPETADSILLYAANEPLFVVDAYTRRVLERHHLIKPSARYDDIKKLVEEAFAGQDLPAAPEKNLGHTPSRMSGAPRSALAQHYNEFHGLLVQLGKRHCRKITPKCSGCPLEKFLPKRKLS